jgi:hypothetical protein
MRVACWDYGSVKAACPERSGKMKIKIADRVYHRRAGRFGAVKNIGVIKAELVWEDKDKAEIEVDVVDLIPDKVAERCEHFA